MFILGETIYGPDSENFSGEVEQFIFPVVSTKLFQTYKDEGFYEGFGTGPEPITVAYKLLKEEKVFKDFLEEKNQKPEKELSKWLDKIDVIFEKTDHSPITDEDIDYIYEHLDRDCYIKPDPTQKNKAILHQNDITWSNWKEELKTFCHDTQGFKVSANVVDEYGTKDSFLGNSKKSYQKIKIDF